MNSKSMALGIAVMTALSFLPGLASGGDVKTDNVTVGDHVKIHLRPSLEIQQAYLAPADNIDLFPDGLPKYNWTTNQRDVWQNMSFYFNVSDRDYMEPNTSNIRRVAFIAYVNFEGDPGNMTPNSSYDKRNYEFYLFAERQGTSGGTNMSLWNVGMEYPTGTGEVMVLPGRSGVVYERDIYKSNNDTGSDGVNDTVTFRIAFRLASQIRNTNSTGDRSADNWNFYCHAIDIDGGCNDTRAWNHTFDVYQYSNITASGNIAGAGTPGGPGFRLSRGQGYHNLEFANNNNATVLVNATNFSGTWLSDTLKVLADGDYNDTSTWTRLGDGFTSLGNVSHPYNGTHSVPYDIAGPGESSGGPMFWMCTGIPAGTASATYESTVSYKIIIDGT